MGKFFFRDPDFLKRGFRYFSLCMSSIVEAKLNVENSKFRLIKNARKFDFELINKSFLIGTEKNTKISFKYSVNWSICVNMIQLSNYC